MSTNGMTATVQVKPDPSQKSEAQTTVEAELSKLMNGASGRNVGRFDRIASVAAGALVLYALRRRLLSTIVFGSMAAYLLFRGVSGRCLVYESLEFDTLNADESIEGALKNLTESARQRRYGNEVQIGSRADGPTDLERDTWMDDGGISESLDESFPASDPPANW